MGMDQFSAHMDRGWDLVKKGDLKSARAAARRALQAERDAPEPYNLLGYIAAQEGEVEEALDHYRHALALDDGYLDPMLNAAEVLVHSLGEFQEALALCDEALSLLEERTGEEGREELVDAVVLKAEAQLGLGDRDGARGTLGLLPEGPLEPALGAVLGRLFAEVGEVGRAEPLLRAALEADPRNIDAQFSLGLVCEERGDHRGASVAWLAARELSLQEPPPGWTLDAEGFRKALAAAMEKIEGPMLEHLREALVLVADVPGLEVVADGVDPRAGVLFDGMTRPGAPGPLAARVFLYQRNIERLCTSAEDVPEELAFVLTEELRHQLAMRTRAEENPAPRPANSAD